MNNPQKTYNILLLIILSIFIASCEQSDPQVIEEDDFYRSGNKLRFSGYDWTIKIYEDEKQGPGPNYFSGREEDIFLDDKGYLHMRIAKHGDKWYSTEIITDKVMSYGTYIFTIEGDVLNIHENTVLGLFTWDSNTFHSDANSEIDIEFSKWGNTNYNKTLKYSVQPLNHQPYYSERTKDIPLSQEQGVGVTTHSFIWTESLITWKSWKGAEYGAGEVIGEWSYDSTNIPRVKEEWGNLSLPVVIPKPGGTTNARINYWIGAWVADYPTDSMEHEIIIRNFDYIPLKN